jgi:hypothetical protein
MTISTRSIKFPKVKFTKLCYLCGRPSPDTDEHIPPRGIFPKKPSGNLITVPAHNACNNKFSQDDELFRNLVIMASWRTKEGQIAWRQQVVPSLAKNPGARKELLKRLIPICLKDVTTGTLLQHEGIKIDLGLCRRQVERWTKGLFYRRFRRPIPANIKIQVDKLQPPEISVPTLNESMAGEGLRPNWVHVEPNIFSYLYEVTDENNLISFAIFVLFNTEVYMASTDVNSSC